MDFVVQDTCSHVLQILEYDGNPLQQFRVLLPRVFAEQLRPLRLSRSCFQRYGPVALPRQVPEAEIFQSSRSWCLMPLWVYGVS